MTQGSEKGTPVDQVYVPQHLWPLATQLQSWCNLDISLYTHNQRAFTLGIWDISKEIWDISERNRECFYVWYFSFHAKVKISEYCECYCIIGLLKTCLDWLEAHKKNVFNSLFSNRLISFINQPFCYHAGWVWWGKWWLHVIADTPVQFLLSKQLHPLHGWCSMLHPLRTASLWALGCRGADSLTRHAVLEQWRTSLKILFRIIIKFLLTILEDPWELSVLCQPWADLFNHNWSFFLGLADECF